MITAGVASIIIAIVGGGANVFGAEIPIIDSGRRQIALALAGAAFLAGAVFLREDAVGAGPDLTVQGYRQEVLAACRLLQQRQPPPQNEDGSYSRDAIIASVQNGGDRADRILDPLWERSVPESLEDDAVRAEEASNEYLQQLPEIVERVGSQLPTRFRDRRLQAFYTALGNESSEHYGRWEAAMSRLADAPCTPPAS